MSYRRWKAHSTTPGDRRWKAGSLGFAPAVADVKTTAHIGDGTAGTLNMSLYTLISGVVSQYNVRSGQSCYTGGPTGLIIVPTVGNVRFGVLVNVEESTGTCRVPVAADVQSGVAVDVSPTVGTFTSPAVGKVISDTSWGAGGTEFTGTYHPTLVAEVLDTVSFGAASAETGTYHAPVAAGYAVLAPGFGDAGGTPGTLAAAKIFDGTYGTLAAGSILVAAGGTYVDPANSDVWHGAAVGVSPRIGTKVGSSITNLTVGNLASGITVDDVGPGTFTHTTDYVAKTGVVAKDYVLVGHYTYPVEQGGQEGTELGYSAGYSAGYDFGTVEQHALDVEVVGGYVAGMLDTVSIWGVVNGTYVAPVQAGYSALAPNYGAGGVTAGTLAASKIRDATYGTLADGSVLVAAGGTYVDPANAGVWYNVAVGVSPRVGTKRASSITNCTVGNVKKDVAIDDVTGTYAGAAGGGPLVGPSALISA